MYIQSICNLITIFHSLAVCVDITFKKFKKTKWIYIYLMCFFKLFHSQNTYTNQYANISNIEKMLPKHGESVQIYI